MKNSTTWHSEQPGESAESLQDTGLRHLAAAVGAAAQERGWHLVTAESCTGGWIAKVITDLPGSSRWFERGLVTYSNEAKETLLKVDPGLIEAHGAVSLPVAMAMALGALKQSRAQAAVAVTGIAGPGGGSTDKPVGTVCFGWATRQIHWADRAHFQGDRETVRRQSVARALRGLEWLLGRRA